MNALEGIVSERRYKMERCLKIDFKFRRPHSRGQECGWFYAKFHQRSPLKSRIWVKINGVELCRKCHRLLCHKHDCDYAEIMAIDGLDDMGTGELTLKRSLVREEKELKVSEDAIVFFFS